MSATIAFDEATRQIFARFLAQWIDGSNNPLTVVNLDDETMPEPGVAWARVAVRENQSATKALGGATKRYERRGTTWIQVFAPAGDAGVTPANQLAVKARAIFEGVRLGPALVFDGGARLVTLGFDGATWYQVNVACPFRYYESH